MSKTILGKLPVDAFGMLELPKIDAQIIEGFRALPDLTGMSSDVMDELGIVGAIPASGLKPTDPKARIVGRALTVQNIPPGMTVPEAVATELRRCGVRVDVDEDGWTIHPGPVAPAVIQTYDDHRMAMSFALLGLRVPGISIAGPACVAKTFPWVSANDTLAMPLALTE